MFSGHLQKNTHKQARNTKKEKQLKLTRAALVAVAPESGLFGKRKRGFH